MLRLRAYLVKEQLEQAIVLYQLNDWIASGVFVVATILDVLMYVSVHLAHLRV
jgi:hypothetical protein